MTDSILYHLSDRGVATLTMNRPELHNAFDEKLIQEMSAKLDAVNADPAVCVLVLTGAGLGFSAGADLDWMRRMAGYDWDDNQREARQLAGLMQRLDTMRMPTIARVQGSAFGAGVGLVACCDIAVAVSDALFSFSETKLGLIPAVVSPYVVRAIGARAARRYFITAERFNASKAQRLGLIHKMAERDELDSEINLFIEPLLHNGPAAMSAAKALVAMVEGRQIDEALIEETTRRIADVRTSTEGREGMRAFLEHRKPGWQA